MTRARLTRETGEIPKDVVLVDFMDADGPVTAADYTFVADMLETKLHQLAREATDEVTAVMRQIHELRFLAQNREPAPAVVETPSLRAGVVTGPGRKIDYGMYAGWAKNIIGFLTAKDVIKNLELTLPSSKSGARLTLEAYQGYYQVLQIVMDRSSVLVERGEMTAAQYVEIIQAIKMAKVKNFKPEGIEGQEVVVRQVIPGSKKAMADSYAKLITRLRDEHDELWRVCQQLGEASSLSESQYSNYLGKAMDIRISIKSLEKSGEDISALLRAYDDYIGLLSHYSPKDPVSHPGAGPRVDRPNTLESPSVPVTTKDPN
jgi:hypothetical protein